MRALARRAGAFRRLVAVNRVEGLVDAVIKLVFDVVAFSSIMVLVVAGLAIIASLMGIFNLGHGEFVLLGAFTVYVFRELGLPVWSGMVAAPILVALFGLVIEATIIRRLYLTPIVAMLATFAIGLIVRETVRILISGQYYAIAEPISGSFTVLGTSLSVWRAFIIAATLVVMTGCYLLLTRTNFGLQIRAALENPALARVRRLDAASLRRHLRLRRGAGGARWCARGPALLAVGRPRRPLPRPGVPLGDARRCGHLRGPTPGGSVGRRHDPRLPMASRDR